MSIKPHRPGRLTQAPFLGSRAVAAGLITRQQLRSAAWRHLFRDVYASASLPHDHTLRVKGAALLLPAGAAIAGRSAAHLWGAKLTDLDDTVEVRAPRGFGPVKGLVIRSGTLDRSEITKRWGMPITTALHTTWDLALYQPDLDAIAWIDQLARARRISARQLLAHAESHVGGRGSKRASELLALCDPRAESAPESKLRVHLVKGGLPAPIPQFDVVCDGFFVARVDLAWPHLKLAIEYDGQWHSDIGQLSRDWERLRTLNDVGWRVYSVTYEDMHDPEQLVRRIRRAYAERLRDSRG